MTSMSSPFEGAQAERPLSPKGCDEKRMGEEKHGGVIRTLAQAHPIEWEGVVGSPKGVTSFREERTMGWTEGKKWGEGAPACHQGA